MFRKYSVVWRPRASFNKKKLDENSYVHGANIIRTMYMYSTEWQKRDRARESVRERESSNCACTRRMYTDKSYKNANDLTVSLDVYFFYNYAWMGRQLGNWIKWSMNMYTLCIAKLIATTTQNDTHTHIWHTHIRCTKPKQNNNSNNIVLNSQNGSRNIWCFPSREIVMISEIDNSKAD